MKVGFYTLGCKVNSYETEYLKEEFIKKGFAISSFDDDNDIYVLNTCTVTNNSDKKNKKIINKLRNKPGIKVVIGCFVESHKDYNYDGIDIVVGNTNKSKVVDYVLSFYGKKVIDIPNIMLSKFDDMSISNFEGRTRAFVKIQDGCNNYCSYCIIPFTRGRNRSKSLLDIINEITLLIKNGYQEIVLTGIETVSYGEDIGTNFSNLIEEVLKIEGLKRLRISSIEISKLDDKFFKLLENDIICNHLHLSLQSGCDEVLALINRKYNTSLFKEKVLQLKKIRPDVSLTTDVIVGFPGETDDYFNKTIEFVKEIGFSKIHVFPYSKRKGTKAAIMKNQIDTFVKKERVNKLILVSNIMHKEYETQFIGKEMDVLIEKIDDNFSYGHTSNFIYLKIPKKLENNKFYKIKIEKDMLDFSDIDLI